jgi:uracil-DNA glycosylase
MAMPALSDDAPVVRSLTALRAAENACRRCPLYANATQAVPGEGSRDAEVMLVGEQPGDKEDLAAKPFVGPAGRLLDQALADAGIARDKAFVTNAVKHFKYEPRGKRRLHKKPNAGEIDRCRWWYQQELAIVKPAVIVALGLTATRAVFGKSMPIGKSRGAALKLADGTVAFVTVHPSALLRVQEREDKEQQYRVFVDDLRQVAKYLRRQAA